MGITQGMGARVQRVEDERYLTGRTAFIDGMALPRMQSVAFVRAEVAHARLLGVDAEAAIACPGVSRVMTGAEANALCRPIRADRGGPSGKRRRYAPTDYPVMAGDRIRYVGEIVAAVVADDRYLAEDAAETMEIAVEPLPAVLDVEQALAPGAPLVHEELDDNRHHYTRLENGEVSAAFSGAHRVVRSSLRTNRLCASPMETRAVLAHPDADGRLVVHTSSQMPHMVRTKLADLLGLPERQIRVVAPDVGGGFGLKCHIFPEELMVAALALQLRRPVKWIEARRENYMAGFHARQERIEFALALGEDGAIDAIDAAFHADGGAYTSFPFTPTAEPTMAASTCTGPYRVRKLRTEAVTAYTNKSTLSVCRGVGLPIVGYALEHSIDRAADALGLDPAELRRRNLLRGEDFPYGTPNFTMYDSGSPLESLEQALALMDYEKLRAEQAQALADGRYLGIGIASMIETTTYGQDLLAPFGKSDNVALHESARLRIEPDGGITLAVGTHSHGQAHATTFAQIVAGVLGCDVADIRFVQGDTDSTPYGSGTWGSRSAVAGGGAVLKAAQRIRGQAVQVAAHLLQVPAAEVEVADDGRFVRKGSKDPGLTRAEVARAALYETNLPLGLDAGLETTASVTPRSPYTIATHIAVVEVDPATGRVDVLKYGVSEDCGPMINPMVVEGQIAGGVVQGIGAALLEQHIYDDSGQLATASMADYRLPTAPFVPRIAMAHMETPSPHSESGIKGMGEGGAVGPVGAVPNAVSDALKPLIGWQPVTELPITPERVHDMLRQHRRGGE